MLQSRITGKSFAENFNNLSKIKEPVTKDDKMKRNQDPKETGQCWALRYCKSTSPYLSDEKSETEMIDPVFPTSCLINGYYTPELGTVSGFGDNSKRERRKSSYSLNYRGSPYEINGINGEVHSIRRYSDPASSLIGTQTMDSNDLEQPLDMSKKSRTSSSESESQNVLTSEVNFSKSAFSRNHSDSLLQLEKQHIRPSVITCAPSFSNTKNASTQNVPNLSNNFSKYFSNNKFNHEPYKKCLLREAILSNKSISKDVQNKVRQEISNSIKLQDNCDSVIDEHFRRSLSNNYQPILNNGSPTKMSSVSTSVDDHFAKALGETWFKLKKNSNNDVKKADYNKMVQVPFDDIYNRI